MNNTASGELSVLYDTDAARSADDDGSSGWVCDHAIR